MENPNLTEYFDKTQEIVVYIDSAKHHYSRSSLEYEKILDALKEITNNSHEMPAFGVSLDNETKIAMQSGTWLELIFANTETYNDMPFDSLLIAVNNEHCGFNLIRKYNGEYAGRCFYLDLNNDMSFLYNTICTLN